MQVGWRHCLAGGLGAVGVLVTVLVVRFQPNVKHVPFHVYVLTLSLNLMLALHLADEKMRKFTGRYLNQLLPLSTNHVRPMQLEERIPAADTSAPASSNLGTEPAVVCISNGTQAIQS